MRRARCAPAGRLALVVLLAVSAAGCRPGTALHNRYNNFRAYYNTYYNATRSLDEGIRSVETSDSRVDIARLVPLFPTGAQGSRAAPFQAAIDKSAELLRTRASSAWADDALLVIGKAYFYQRNLVGAEQKFRETMDAATLRGDRRLADEARFWLGRTLATGGRFDDGTAVLQDGLAQDGGDRRWRARMALALAELYAWAGRWDEAAPALRAGLADTRDPDLYARASLLLGQVEEAAGRFDAAADAYADAHRRRPAYEIAYAAQLSEALVLGLDAGRSDEALARIRAMRRDDKHYARRAELALAQARILARSGDDLAAEALFRDVLYDETYDGQAIRGQVHARLAEFYRDVREDYVRAAAHFDTAATALPAAPTAADRPSREALVGIPRQAVTFGSVATITRRIADIDSLLALGMLDDDALAARVAEIESERLRVWQAEQQRLAQVRAAQEFGGTVGAPGFDPGPDAARSGTDAPPAAGAPGAPTGTPGAPAAGVSEAGFLSFRDVASVQNGLIAFQRIWGDRPLVQHWRRLEAVRASTALADADGDGTPGIGRPGAGGPPPVDLSAVPRLPEQQDALRAERAALRYELGNAFFFALERADLGREVYASILDEAPGAPVTLRTRYALAELEASEGQAERARALYAEVAAADAGGAIGRAAQARLDGRELETEAGPAPDDAAYAAARQLWAEGDPLNAAVALVRLGDANPDADIAPRAFYAAAAAVASVAAGDSLRLASPLPDSLVPAEVRLAFVEAAPPPAPPAPPPAPALDSVGVDTLDVPLAVPDSTLAPEPAATPPDSTTPEPSVAGPALLDVLMWIEQRYASAPIASTVTSLRAALQERVRPAVADDTTEIAPPPEAPAAAPSGLTGTDPINPEDGGFTWRVLTQTSVEAAETGLEGVVGRFRRAIVTDGALYYVVVGQFETMEAAEASRGELAPRDRAQAVVIPLRGFRLVRDASSSVSTLPPVSAPTGRPTDQ